MKNVTMNTGPYVEFSRGKDIFNSKAQTIKLLLLLNISVLCYIVLNNNIMNRWCTFYITAFICYSYFAVTTTKERKVVKNSLVTKQLPQFMFTYVLTVMFELERNALLKEREVYNVVSLVISN